jgi:hypothetical protein
MRSSSMRSSSSSSSSSSSRLCAAGRDEAQVVNLQRQRHVWKLGAASVCFQGETWQAVIKGHELDPMSQQQDQQRLLLERFQREVRAPCRARVSSWCLQPGSMLPFFTVLGLPDCHVLS